MSAQRSARTPRQIAHPDLLREARQAEQLNGARDGNRSLLVPQQRSCLQKTEQHRAQKLRASVAAVQSLSRLALDIRMAPEGEGPAAGAGT